MSQTEAFGQAELQTYVMTYEKYEAGTRSNHAIKTSTTKSIYFLVVF